MGVKTAQEATEKWQRNASRATEDYKKGIDRVDVSPTDKAADNLDKLLEGITASITSGRMEKALRSVSLSEWKRLAKEKGGANYGTGIKAGANKMQRAMGVIIPHVTSLKERLEAMPNRSLEDSIARQEFWTRGMNEIKGKVKGA